jgi:hypothetical protein
MIETVLFESVFVLASAAALIIAGDVRASARAGLRSASALYLLLAPVPFASPPLRGLAHALAIFVCVLAPCLLSITLATEFDNGKRRTSTRLLMAAVLGAILSAISDWVAPGAVPFLVTVAILIGAAGRGFGRASLAAVQALASVLACASAMAIVFGNSAGFGVSALLFAAAGLLGSASAIERLSRPVDDRGAHRSVLRLIGR